MGRFSFGNNIYAARGAKASAFAAAGFALMFAAGCSLMLSGWALALRILLSAALAASGAALLRAARLIYERNTRIAAYLSAMAGRGKIPLKELGELFSQTAADAAGDIEACVSAGLIPTGRITPDGLFFKIGPPEGDELIDTGKTAPESMDFIDEGRSYIKRLEKANASLFSNRFFASALEKAAASSKALFGYVEAYPGKMPAVKIDVNVNLRRALEFIDEYKELARFSMDGKRINELKSGAVEALETASKDFDGLRAALSAPDEREDSYISGSTAADMIKAGRACVRRIRRAGESLADKEASEKLDKTETLMERVFDYAERHPEKSAEIKKLMSRHLPMVLRLMDSYGEFGRLGIKSDEGSSLKKEITGAVDAVNEALETLLSNLARGIVLDISTDIDVLKAVLIQDGLINNDDFKPKDK